MRYSQMHSVTFSQLEKPTLPHLKPEHWNAWVCAVVVESPAIKGGLQYHKPKINSRGNHWDHDLLVTPGAKSLLDLRISIRPPARQEQCMYEQHGSHFGLALLKLEKRNPKGILHYSSTARAWYLGGEASSNTWAHSWDSTRDLEKVFAWELGCIAHPSSGEIPVFEKCVLSPTSKKWIGRISQGLWLWSPISKQYRVFALWPFLWEVLRGCWAEADSCCSRREALSRSK